MDNLLGERDKEVILKILLVQTHKGYKNFNLGSYKQWVKIQLNSSLCALDDMEVKEELGV